MAEQQEMYCGAGTVRRSRKYKEDQELQGGEGNVRQSRKCKAK